MLSADKILQLYLITAALWFASFIIGAYRQNDTHFGIFRIWIVSARPKTLKIATTNKINLNLV